MANPTAYPDQFPTKEITSVVTYLRGGGDLKTTLFDSYVVEGYALGVTVGNPQAAVAQKATPALDTNEQKAAALESLVPKQGKAAAGFTLPPWVLTVVIPLIEELLKKLLGG